MYQDITSVMVMVSAITSTTARNDATGTSSTKQQDISRRQFGTHANAYLTSTVHASGMDLAFFAERAGALRPIRALDVGCGAGHAAFAIAAGAGEVTASDPSGEMLAAVSAEAERRGLGNIVTRQGSAMTLPFPDAHFDLVVTRYSAHHWPALSAALRECARVLKMGGRMLVTDSAAPEAALLDSYLQTVEVLRDLSHARNYRSTEWREAMAQAGMELVHAEMWKQPIAFAPWIERLGTPALRADAVRAVFGGAPSEVREHFRVQEDSSFTLDVLTAEAVKTGNRRG